MLFPSSIILMEAVNTASTAAGSFRSRRVPVITSVDSVPTEQMGSSGGLDNLANSGQDHLDLCLAHVIGINCRAGSNRTSWPVPLVEPDDTICEWLPIAQASSRRWHWGAFASFCSVLGTRYRLCEGHGLRLFEISMYYNGSVFQKDDCH